MESKPEDAGKVKPASLGSMPRNEDGKVEANDAFEASNTKNPYVLSNESLKRCAPLALKFCKVEDYQQ